ncbi:hypothetical protein FZC76_06960 [Sutcliffiella horikoshii]|uniref:Uncharacterized protein n=1 Tax=Sutcliffiella horikoshii TaxID=79883 RepID=A0A5D4T0C9_9BACI|nr:hypothetical protein [Sutcliffiella horikoshii]TYS68679.1 hypothetical protein FZC76_06960 [Sutcliffiella horikoshii]
MQIREWYLDAVDYNQESLLLLLDFLIYEKKVLAMDDDEEKLRFYFQEKFRNRMNEHLKEYKERLELQTGG